MRKQNKNHPRKKVKSRNATLVRFILLLLVLIIIIFPIKSNTEPEMPKTHNQTIRLVTYNTMFGMYGRNIGGQTLAHLLFHGFHAKTLTNWFSNQNTKTAILVSKKEADIISLNEVLGTLKKEELISQFRKEGYDYFCWGPAGHYAPPMDLGTLVISKYKFENLNFSLPMSDHMGGGGGACAIFIEEKNLVVLAVHFGLREDLFREQIIAVSDFIKKQENKKRKIVLMGDFNRNEKEMEKFREFDEDNLIESTKEKTCPNVEFLKLIDFKSVDNIYYSNNIQLEKAKVFNGYSDHKGVLADLQI